jgi:hypothetical protein
LPVIGSGLEVDSLPALAVTLIAAAVVLILMGALYTVIRRIRLSALQRRRIALEAEVDRLKAGQIALQQAPVPPRRKDMEPCFFCAEPIDIKALICHHCQRPSIRNLDAFAQYEAKMRLRVTAASAGRAESGGGAR